MGIKAPLGAAMLAAVILPACVSASSAAPVAPAGLRVEASGSAVTPVEWRYRWHRGHRERYWFGPRIIRRILRDL